MSDTDAITKLNELVTRALAELQTCADEAALRLWHTKYFGDKGEMTQALGLIGTLPKDQRAAFGKEANRVKQALTAAYEEALAKAKELALMASLNESPLDVSLPGRP